MKCRLKSYEIGPPGSYVYKQEQGIRRPFGPSPSIEGLAAELSGFRTKNGLPRASVQESLEDIDAYTCFRLGNMPAYCTCSDSQGNPTPALNAGSPIGKPCRGCGAPILTAQ